VLLAASLSTLSINFFSNFLVLLRQVYHYSCHGLQLLLAEPWWCTIWMTGGISTLLMFWTCGHRPNPNHAAFLSWKARRLTLRNFAYSSQTAPNDEGRESVGWMR